MRNQIRLHFISFRKAVFVIAERTRRCLLERYMERTSKGCRGLNEWSYGPRGLKNSHLVFNTKMLLVARCSMVTDHLQCHRRHARRVLSLRCRLIGAQRTSQERARGCHQRTERPFHRCDAHLVCVRGLVPPRYYKLLLPQVRFQSVRRYEWQNLICRPNYVTKQVRTPSSTACLGKRFQSVRRYEGHIRYHQILFLQSLCVSACFQSCAAACAVLPP